MRRRTTTKKLQQVIANNLLVVEKAEIYHKSTSQTDIIEADTFRESLDFLCESIFADSIGWHFEKDFRTGNYVVNCSRMDGNTDIVIIAHLCACDSVSKEDIERALLFVEEE